MAEEADDRQEEPRAPAAVPDRDLAHRPARQPRLPAAHELVRDLGPGVAGADDQHAALAQLRRPAVPAGVQLHDPGVELRGEGGKPRRPVRARRDHDVVGLEPLVAGRDDEAVAVLRHAVDPHAGPDRKVEAGRVRLEVVRHLVLGRERPARRREAPARQAVVPRRREQAQRVPTPAPGVADPLAAVQDHDLPPPLRQVVADGEARLAPADDHGLDPPLDQPCAVAAHRRAPLVGCQIDARRTASGGHRANRPTCRPCDMVKIDHAG